MILVGSGHLPCTSKQMLRIRRNKLNTSKGRGRIELCCISEGTEEDHYD